MDLENNLFLEYNHWDSTVIILTVIVLMIIITSLVTVLSITKLHLVIKFLTAILLIGSVVFSFYFLPISISINANEIKINRIIGSLKLPLNDVSFISPLSSDMISDSIRTFASGGLFGYLGKFKNDKLGNYTMYATEKNNLLLIKKGNVNYIFNCRESRRLIEIYNKAKQN